MKTNIQFLSALLMNVMPMALAAQPLVSTNEYYHIGDVIQMVNCNAAGVSAGVSGSNVTWDFSGLVPSGGNSVTSVVHDTAAAFPTADILITLPNGLKQHVQENNTDSYVLGVTDTVSGSVANYYNYDLSKRPVTYLTNYVDTYQVTIPATVTSGKGYLVTTGDAYGSLMLPSVTYNNVLRVKKIQNENDTINGTTIITTTTISYLWFDTINHPPLLRMDSVIGSIGAGNTVMYLSLPAASVTGVKQMPGNYQCYLHDDELLVSGNFIFGKMYNVTMYNLIGQKIYSNKFTADGISARFDIDKRVVPGIYIVSIIQSNDPSDEAIIKVVKQ